MDIGSLTEVLLAVKDATLKFNTTTFRNIFKRNHHLMAKLKGIYVALSKLHFDFLVNLEKILWISITKSLSKRRCYGSKSQELTK